MKWRGSELLSKEPVPGEGGKNLLRFLLYDIPWPPTLKAEIREHFEGKRSLLLELKASIQEALDRLEIENESVELGEAAVFSLLSYYALFEPKTDEKITLPCYANGRWERVAFRVERRSTLPAFFLHPQKVGVRPILLFQGSKRLAHWFFDFFPLTSAGMVPFLLHKRQIKEWLTEPVRCVGMSLGGSLALLTASNFPEKAEAFALVPSGLYFPDACQGTALIDPKDRVSSVGFFPRGLRLIHAKRPFGTIMAHMRMFSAHPYEAEETSPKAVNRERLRLPLTLLKEGVSLMLLPFFAAVFLIRPVYRLLKAFRR